MLTVHAMIHGLEGGAERVKAAPGSKMVLLKAGQRADAKAEGSLELDEHSPATELPWSRHARFRLVHLSGPRQARPSCGAGAPEIEAGVCHLPINH